MKGFAPLLFLLLIACEDVIKLHLPFDENQIVVIGWVTNEMKNHEVEVSRTQGFNDPPRDVFVDNAVVKVMTLSGGGFKYSFKKDRYISDSVFQGKEGELYGIQVIVGEDTILSNFEALQNEVGIDSIAFVTYGENLPEEVLSNNEPFMEVKYPIIFSKDSLGLRNYYRFVIKKNGFLYNDPQNIELLNDEAFNGNHFLHELRSYFFQNGDTAMIELRSTSQSAFEFLELIKIQATLLGTSLGPSAAIISGNLVSQRKNQIVLGYFGCYAVHTKEVVL